MNIDYDLHSRELDLCYERVFFAFEKLERHLKAAVLTDITPITFKRAICHPYLGGELREDESKDIPGKSFTVSSLRLAASKGDLQTFWNGSNQFVTQSAIRDWITRTDSGKKKTSSPPVIGYVQPQRRTLHEKTLDEQALDRVNEAFSSVDAMVKKSKNKKTKGR